jgi:hypothetical protein
MEMIRKQEDCEDKQLWEHKRRVAERRRQAVVQPLTPAMGTVQFVKSIY